MTDGCWCFHQAASAFFVLLLLCCLKSSMSSSDGCLRTCCILAQLATATDPLKTKSLLVVRWLRKDSVLRVWPMLRFCKRLALSFSLRMPCVFKKKSVIFCSVHCGCLIFILSVYGALYFFFFLLCCITLLHKGKSGSPKPAP